MTIANLNGPKKITPSLLEEGQSLFCLAESEWATRVAIESHTKETIFLTPNRYLARKVDRMKCDYPNLHGIHAQGNSNYHRGKVADRVVVQDAHLIGKDYVSVIAPMLVRRPETQVIAQSPTMRVPADSLGGWFVDSGVTVAISPNSSVS